MKPPVIPHDEAIRLKALHDTNLLDTPAEERFDRLTRLVRQLLSTPMAVISLVDSHRQWFKSKQGIDACETGRDISFCGHAILQESTLYVPDALADPRFHDNPLVLGPPHIRFYAGAPLTSTSGQRIGTLCAIDTQPRTLDAQQLTAFRDLADCVEDEVNHAHLKLQNRALTALASIAALGEDGHWEQLQKALETGRNYLGLDAGLISQLSINGHHALSYSPTHSDISGLQLFNAAQQHLDASMAAMDVVVVEAATPTDSLPAEQPTIRSFIGAPILVDGKVNGALGFFSFDPSPPVEFSSIDVAFVRLLARWVSKTVRQDITDESLRWQYRLGEVITKAQSRFINESSQRSAFDGLLADFIDLTQSEFGLISEALPTENTGSGSNKVELCNISWNIDNKAYFADKAPEGMAFQNPATLFGAALASGRIRLSNCPTEGPQGSGLPVDHPPLKSFMCIPIHHGSRLVAMLAVANRPDGYESTLIDQLHPLITTIGQLVEAARATRQQRADQLMLARLSSVASQTTNSVIITDITGRIDWVNEGFTRSTGFTFGEVKGKFPGDFLHGPLSDAKTIARMLEARASQKAYEEDIINYTKSGDHFWVHVSGVPLRDRYGVNQGFITIKSDISERKRHEEAIRKSEQRLAAVIEGTNVGTWEWNIETGELVLNERWARISGYSLQELLPTRLSTWIDLIHTDDLRPLHDSLQKNLSGESEFYEARYRIRHKTDGWVWVQDTGRVFQRTSSGRPLLMSGTHADVTAQVLSQEKLAHAHDLLEKSNEAARIGTWEFDLKTKQLHWSRMALKIYEADDNLHFKTDQALAFYKPGENRKAITHALANAIDHGDPFDMELEILTALGHDRWVRIVGVPVIIDNLCTRLYGLVQDVSERRRIDQMKSQFVSTVSHELRTPLTSINGSLALIDSGALGELPGMAKELITIASRNGARLISLINDLLDMEKLLAGKFQFEMEQHQLQALVEQAISNNQGYAAQHQVTLELVSSDASANVTVDESRFQQVLANLLSNAAKFSPPGGRVEVAIRRHDGWARVDVVDHGPGIPKAFQGRIFEKFSQADGSDSRSKGGTGLGLAITRELVERMHGRVGFESEEGRGSTFHVEFPVDPE